MTDTQREPDTTKTATHDAITNEAITNEAIADGAIADGVAGGDTAAVGELSWVDPRSLIVGVNIRGEANLDRHFVRDIADRGVREPIPVRRREDGALVVRKGKRRTLAAIEAGLERVRVFIEPEPDAAPDDPAAQIDRIVDQLGENHHRRTASDADEVRAHQELLDLGLSAGQIARRTHTSTKRVRITTAVARSELASAVLARYDLTLDQVAVIAEFDDRTKAGVEAVTLLTVTAQREPGQFVHVAQRLRDQREDQQCSATPLESPNSTRPGSGSSTPTAPPKPTPTRSRDPATPPPAPYVVESAAEGGGPERHRAHRGRSRRMRRSCGVG